jgi:WS/DGAT/MGAT family acyltransferase
MEVATKGGAVAARTFRTPVERVSANDATLLATDHGTVPMNLGAVVVVRGGARLELRDVTDLLGDRLPRVRRLRQRLVATPPGCGRPIWVDAADFDKDEHVRGAGVTGHDGLLELAADLLCTRLDPHRPLWVARWVTGLPHDDAALVVVLHHCLSDGLGGMAALAALCDGSRPQDDLAGTITQALEAGFPLPEPSARILAREAWRARVIGLGRVTRRLDATSHGIGELGLRARPRLAPRTSLNRPTGPRRRLGVTVTRLAPLVEVAHARGCTLNDLMLCAVAGGLGRLFRGRGESVPEIVASVPVSARRTTTADRLGNATGVLPLALPLAADRDERLRRVAALTAERRGPARGSSAGPLGLAFRTLGALNVFQPFINRQRLVNTFVTNVRGPAMPLSFAGLPVTSITPMAVNPGNVGVSFDVLSYAGQLVVTVVADPDLMADPASLATWVGDELAALVV